MYLIKQLNKSNAAEVNIIRKQSYAQAKGMKVKDEGIFWNQSDEQSIVFGVFHRDHLIATMRGEIITDLPLIEKKMECPWTYGDLELPSMILSKAAVKSNYQNKGLTSVLRLIFFQLAQRWHIKTILGTMTANSLRINGMKALGYTFVENPIGWKDDNYMSSEKVLISILDFDQFGASSLQVLNKKYKNYMKENFSLDFTSISYNEVKVVS